MSWQRILLKLFECKWKFSFLSLSYQFYAVIIFINLTILKKKMKRLMLNSRFWNFNLISMRNVQNEKVIFLSGFYFNIIIRKPHYAPEWRVKYFLHTIFVFRTKTMTISHTMRKGFQKVSLILKLWRQKSMTNAFYAIEP